MPMSSSEATRARRGTWCSTTHREENGRHAPRLAWVMLACVCLCGPAQPARCQTLVIAADVFPDPVASGFPATLNLAHQAFGSGVLAGSSNMLLWISYVIMLSLYAHAFGSYAASFVSGPAQVVWTHIFISKNTRFCSGISTSRLRKSRTICCRG